MQTLVPAMGLQDEKFQSAPGSKVGTPAYLAPEVISTTRGRTYDGKVGVQGSPCTSYSVLAPEYSAASLISPGYRADVVLWLLHTTGFVVLVSSGLSCRL